MVAFFFTQAGAVSTYGFGTLNLTEQLVPKRYAALKKRPPQHITS